MAKIDVIQPEEARGRLKEIYDDLIEKRGKIAEVHKIQSLRPESIVKHMDLYLEIMFSKSELSRAQREMMAVVVSVSNRCSYCQIHHAQALLHYWKDEQKVNDLRKDYRLLDLSDKNQKLCEYAERLSCEPWDDGKPPVDSLKSEGFSDQAILDATLVVAYFNFVNRIVLGLGVEVSETEKSGYNY